MTLDDLEQIYDQAKADQFNSGKRAGIRAVVAALRDEIAAEPYYQAVTVLDEILASDGEVKAAGVAALEVAGAGLSPASGQAPAAAPVCEWGRGLKATSFGWVHLAESENGQGFCPDCGRPVKFKSETAR